MLRSPCKQFNALQGWGWYFLGFPLDPIKYLKWGSSISLKLNQIFLILFENSVLLKNVFFSRDYRQIGYIRHIIFCVRTYTHMLKKEGFQPLVCWFMYTRIISSNYTATAIRKNKTPTRCAHTQKKTNMYAGKSY